MLQSLISLISDSGVSSFHGVHGIDELEEAQAMNLLRPHGIRILDRDARLDASMSSVIVSETMSLHHLVYGCAVDIAPKEPDGDNFLLCAAVSGVAKYRTGSQNAVLRPQELSAITPYHEFASETSSDFSQIIVSLNRKNVENTVASLTGSGGVRQVELTYPQDIISLTNATVSLWSSLAALAASGASYEREAARRIEEIALEQILLGFPSVQARIVASTEVASARSVRLAMQYMRDHLGEPISITELATAVSVAPRSLQLAFRKELDNTVTGTLREMRLGHARKLLVSQDPRFGTVTQVAHAVGMGHLGNFAVEYRRLFGESPSAALRANRQ
jgi:AraC-like DNA-binding protein